MSLKDNALTKCCYMSSLTDILCHTLHLYALPPSCNPPFSLGPTYVLYGIAKLLHLTQVSTYDIDSCEDI